jgi:GTP-binding protein Era
MKKFDVVVLGAPNCGKSTLINSLVESEICIVSDKPHTTRDRTLAILEKGDTQIVFLDTPGIDISRKSYAIKMKKEALSASHMAEMQIFIFDASKKPRMDILQFASETSVPKIAIVNKIDLVSKGRLLPFTAEISRIFSKVFFISAKNKIGCDLLINYLLENALESPWDFENQKTTRSFQKIIEDKIREGIFKYMYNEIPYNTKIEITELEKKNKALLIRAKIHCTKSHKPILLSKIKEIGIFARERIKNYIGQECHLFLLIKDDIHGYGTR